jgi:hypothetical protein
MHDADPIPFLFRLCHLRMHAMHQARSRSTAYRERSGWHSQGARFSTVEFLIVVDRKVLADRGQDKSRPIEKLNIEIYSHAHAYKTEHARVSKLSFITQLHVT